MTRSDEVFAISQGRAQAPVAAATWAGPRDLAALMAAAMVFVWTVGIGWLVTQPSFFVVSSPLPALGTGQMTRLDVEAIAGAAALITGLATWWAAPFAARVRQLREAGAWLLTPTALLLWHLAAGWPAAWPAGEATLRWERGPETWFAAAIALGAVTTVAVTLAIMANRRRGASAVLAVAGLVWVAVGSGVARPYAITASTSVAGAHWPGPCARLLGAPHLSPALVVGGVATILVGLTLAAIDGHRDRPRSTVALVALVAPVVAVSAAAAVVVWAMTTSASLGVVPCFEQ